MRTVCQPLTVVHALQERGICGRSERTIIPDRPQSVLLRVFHQLRQFWVVATCFVEGTPRFMPGRRCVKLKLAAEL